MAKQANRLNDLPAVERREVQWVPLGELRLDPRNPRLPEGSENAPQPELLSILAKDYDLLELGQSIADNGYFSEEPLVTIKDRNKRGTWTVVEGNRRLAALMLLQNPDAAPPTSRERWNALSKERKRVVAEVPILEYEKRSEVIPYLGFRHITGVLQWRPFQKARYIAQLVEDAKLTFSQIARTIGSRIPTVREHYIAYTLVRQARDQFLIDTKYAEESFGVLRRALSDPDIRAFMGLDLGKSERELESPVAKSKAAAIKEVFQWVFGTEKSDAAIKDSRELRKLGAVLASNRAVDVLRSSKNLDYAFEISGGEERKLIENLNSASYFLDQALPLALRHNKDRNVITATKKCADTLSEILRHFPTITIRQD